MSSELCFVEGRSSSSRDESHPKVEGRGSRRNPDLEKGIFRYADSLDYCLMLIGTIGAAGNGILITLFSTFFGDLVS